MQLHLWRLHRRHSSRRPGRPGWGKNGFQREKYNMIIKYNKQQFDIFRFLWIFRFFWAQLVLDTHFHAPDEDCFEEVSGQHAPEVWKIAVFDS